MDEIEKQIEEVILSFKYDARGALKDKTLYLFRDILLSLHKRVEQSLAVNGQRALIQVNRSNDLEKRVEVLEKDKDDEYWAVVKGEPVRTVKGKLVFTGKGKPPEYSDE